MTKEIIELKSINIKTIGKPRKEDVNQVAFYITGVATSVFSTITDYGEQQGLKGDFVAINPRFPDKQYVSTAAFLPKQFMKTIAEKLASGSMEVEFSATIRVVESKKNDKGIAYIAEEPVTQERVNRQKFLLEKAAQQSLLLLENK